jgi:4-hydroxy-tetrahydrodipicolinate reductase
VGKSSLVNAISPEIAAKVGEISKTHDTGMHTTTYTEMFEFMPDSYIVDTPGVKGFGTFDMEVEEMHHRRKVDAPSGTAIALAEALNEGAGEGYHFTYDRSGRRQPRDDKEIGISALRGGTVVGIHDVIFAGQDEVIEFKHTAYSRAIFAKGAVQAAKFMAGKGAGMYDMADVIG